MLSFFPRDVFSEIWDLIDKFLSVLLPFLTDAFCETKTSKGSL